MRPKHFNIEVETWKGSFEECTKHSTRSHWRGVKAILRWARKHDLKAVVHVHRWRNILCKMPMGFRNLK